MENIIKLSNIKVDSTVQQRWDKIHNLGYSVVPLSLAKHHNLLIDNNAFDTGLETVVKFEDGVPISPLMADEGIPYLKFKGSIKQEDIGEIMVNLDDYGDLRIDKVIAMKDMEWDEDAFSINEYSRGDDRTKVKLDRHGKDDYVELASKVAGKLNLTLYNVLGKGANGIAYLCNDGKVLKITKALDEVIEAHKFMGKQTKHIGTIYSVYRLKNKIDNSYQGVILTEYVDVDNSFFQGLINKMDNLYEDLFPENFESLDDILSEYILYNDAEHENNFNGVENALLENCEQADKKYFSDMFNIYRELKAGGSKSIDVHAGNLGFKQNGNIAYFDLGLGDIDTDKHINKLKIK